MTAHDERIIDVLEAQDFLTTLVEQEAGRSAPASPDR